MKGEVEQKLNIIYHIRDGDGVLDQYDNCPDLPNADQSDTDDDKQGKAI